MRQRTSGRTMRRYARLADLDPMAISHAMVRGGTDHRVDLCLHSGAILSFWPHSGEIASGGQWKRLAEIGPAEATVWARIEKERADRAAEGVRCAAKRAAQEKAGERRARRRQNSIYTLAIEARLAHPNLTLDEVWRLLVREHPAKHFAWGYTSKYLRMADRHLALLRRASGG